MRFIIYVTFLLTACSSTKHLVYIDDWEGKYTLIEYNSCCDTATKVNLIVNRKETDSYSWKMFGGKLEKDTLFGDADYEKKQLKFFVNNNDNANSYFVEKVTRQSPIFKIEYDNYSSDKEFKYIDYFTRWYNELKDYRRVNRLFAGISYHFKKENRNKSIKIPK